jgi:hypothetical protein
MSAVVAILLWYVFKVCCNVAHSTRRLLVQDLGAKCNDLCFILTGINVSPVHHTSDYERQRYHPDVREHRF